MDLRPLRRLELAPRYELRSLRNRSMPGAEEMIALYDLSRLLDRVHAIRGELEDISVTTVDGGVDPEVRSAAGDALTALEPLQSTIEDLLGDPRNYREAALGA